jgi:uncharacterized coiled-coil protein SlyX
VPDLEERVALLEGRVKEQAAFMTDLRTLGASLRQEMRDLREETRHLREDLGKEIRHLREEVNRRFEAVDRRFFWLVAIVVTGFVTVIGTVASAFWGVLQVVR